MIHQLDLSLFTFLLILRFVELIQSSNLFLQGKSKLPRRNAAAREMLKEVVLASEDVGCDMQLLHDHLVILGDLNYRMNTPTVSVVDFTAMLENEASAEQINAAMKAAAEGPLKGILRYTEEPLVSTDLRGDEHSSIFSAIDTITLGKHVKVVSWYDNEWGYSNRIADLLKFLADKGF